MFCICSSVLALITIGASHQRILILTAIGTSIFLLAATSLTIAAFTIQHAMFALYLFVTIFAGITNRAIGAAATIMPSAKAYGKNERRMNLWANKNRRVHCP